MNAPSGAALGVESRNEPLKQKGRDASRGLFLDFRFILANPRKSATHF
jgi:hypothetical protein